MCGITGFWSPEGVAPEFARNMVRVMADQIAHRGPDDTGTWVDGMAGIALGHRRLSIVDLSAAGHQPMASRNGRYVVIFNGEAYNHQDLRDELAAEPGEWRGRSDTETLLAGFDRWGIVATLQRTVGMFALACWDREERTLILARDRMGEKPLYYGWQGKTFLFASELKALRPHPDFRGELARSSVALFLRHTYVPAPFCIYEGMRKLLPGTVLRIGGGDLGRLPEPEPYWSLRETAMRAAADPFRGSENEAAGELERLIHSAVSLQRVADVPLGAFLSGGIDSSTIVAVMQAQSQSRVKTFTIGFHEGGFNEAEHAKEVARHLGTDHTELYVTARQALDVIPHLPSLYDEPFGDSSAIPTHLLSQLARRHVTVSLSGDGGDELFFGYRRYLRSTRIARRIGRIPRPLRQLMAYGARGALAAGTSLPAMLRSPRNEQKGRRLSELLVAPSPSVIYRCLTSHWNDPGSVVLRSDEPLTPLIDAAASPAGLSLERTWMFLDALTTLPEDILTKVDRAAMAVGLETRVPFLDHRIVEFAQSLPVRYLYANGRGKIVLRHVLNRYVPAAMIERPKRGFTVPIGLWLKGPLRAWAEELLSPARMKDEGIFDVSLVRRKWNEFQEGRGSWESQIWDVLMFQAWLESLTAVPTPGTTAVHP